MAAPPRGRGYAISALSSSNSPVQPLRRPGNFGVRQQSNNNNKIEKTMVEEEDKITKLCNRIGEMSLSNPERDLQTIETEVMLLCNSSENLQTFVDKIVLFALKSKWNAHAIALFCEQYFDVTTQNTKLRTLLLRKLQSIYLERNKNYLTLEKFFMDVTLMCEVFYHAKIDGNCIQFLAHPIIEYLGMLIDGGSQKEIEIFYEQFPKCLKNLSLNDPDGFTGLTIKIRKQLVSESCCVTVRAMLLSLFEMVLTDCQPPHQDVENFYNAISKPIVRICE